MDSDKSIKQYLDQYKCLYITLLEPFKFKDLQSKIESLITSYKNQEKKVNLIFLKIPQKYSELFHPLIESGYSLHFVKDEKLCLHKKIKPDKQIPTFATHHIGVGGIVFSKDFQKVLILKGIDTNLRKSKKKMKNFNHRKFRPFQRVLENPDRSN